MRRHAPRRCARVTAGLLLFAMVITGVGCSSDPNSGRPPLIELEKIDDRVLGDWWDVDSSPARPYFVRLQEDGVFLEGTYETFGRDPSTWRAARIHLIRQESLLVDLGAFGTCAYYVRMSPPHEIPTRMQWLPDRGEPDLIPFKDISGTGLARPDTCPEWMWQRIID